MDEQEWVTCDDPEKMLMFLHESRKLSEGKLRLFTVACYRRVWPLLVDDRSRKAVTVAEEYADGLVNERGRASAEHWANEASKVAESGIPWFAALAAKMTVASHIPISKVVEYTPGDFVNRPEEVQTRKRKQAQLLRDIVGPLPFRPVPLAASVLAWNDRQVVKLASAVYEERSLPEGTLDSVRLAVLADATEEAGCTNALILDHLRSAGPHVRGCWAVDLLIDKE